MATNAWDLRDGFTKDFNLADSAVNAADKMYLDAQRIIDNAYTLDIKSATMGQAVDTTNETNLRKFNEARAFNDQYGFDKSVSDALAQITDLRTDGANVYNGLGEVPSPQIRGNVEIPATTDGQAVSASTGRDIAVGFSDAGGVRPVSRVLTTREKLEYILPSLPTPQARAAAARQIRNEYVNEAYQYHSIAPDKAVNLLIEGGYISGQRMSKNTDGTYSTTLPDGQVLTRDAHGAAAWAGDLIKNTNEDFKLRESIRIAQVARDKSTQDAREAIAREEQKTKDASALQRQRTEDRMTVDNQAAQRKRQDVETRFILGREAAADDARLRGESDLGTNSAGTGGSSNTGRNAAQIIFDKSGVKDFNYDAVLSGKTLDQIGQESKQMAQAALDSDTQGRRDRAKAILQGLDRYVSQRRNANKDFANDTVGRLESEKIKADTELRGMEADVATIAKGGSLKVTPQQRKLLNVTRNAAEKADAALRKSKQELWGEK